MRKKVFVLMMMLFFAMLTAFVGVDNSEAYFPPKRINIPFDQKSFELGRLLFYDPILSSNNTISCSSCHSSYNGFAHADHALSHGINNSILTRNAPALFNLAWQKDLMWDGAINSLLAQPLAPISNHKEMGSSIKEVVEKLNRNSFYRLKFGEVFQTSFIQSHEVLTALQSFQINLISKNAKYDSVMQHLASFTAQEERGYALFQNHCNTCHQEPLFTNTSFANNGLPIDTQLKDYGRFNITQLTQDSMMFKVPSLRNLSYTYPYMHDGRFKTLNEVMNHYSKGIAKATFIAPELKGGIALNAEEKVDLIAFLLTLNDQHFLKNKEYSYPIELRNITK
jgi:cytochrome c peroxidase